MSAEIIRTFMARRLEQLQAARKVKKHKAKMQSIADGYKSLRENK